MYSIMRHKFTQLTYGETVYIGILIWLDIRKSISLCFAVLSIRIPNVITNCLIRIGLYLNLRFVWPRIWSRWSRAWTWVWACGCGRGCGCGCSCGGDGGGGCGCGCDCCCCCCCRCCCCCACASSCARDCNCVNNCGETCCEKDSIR